MSGPPSRLRLGTDLAGRYELRELLGDGAMGSVYRAFDRELEREVAVKSMLPELSAHPDFIGRFQREARALARLRHPNIIGVHDLVRPPEGGLYLILELVRGRSLDAEMRLDAPLAWERCVRVGVDVCRALGAAHAAGVVHRDIKPANILIGDDGEARVADFGIARLAGGVATTRVGVVIGTPQYFSPEQADARPATPQSDLYSLCVVLFEGATGRLPFDSTGGVLRVAMQHLNSPVPDPRTFRPDLPAEAAALIVRGLAKAPEDRFGDADELAAALQATLVAVDVDTAPRTSRRPEPARRTAPAPPPPDPTQALAPADVPTVRDTVPPEPETVVSPRGSATTVEGVTVARTTWQPPDVGDPVRRRRRRRIAWSGAAVAAALIGTVVGLSLGGGGGAPEPAQAQSPVVEVAGVTTRLPSGWGPAPGGSPTLGLSQARTFTAAEAPAGGSVTVGRADEVGPDLLPTALRAGLTVAPVQERVDLDGEAALRYSGLRAAGVDGALTIYSVPTDGGVLTVACVAPATGAVDVGAACRGAAAALELGGERVHALDPDPVYARSLQSVLDRLARTRDAAADALRDARLPRRQAAAARRLSTAFATAASAIAAIDAGPARDDVTAALAAAAGRGEDAFARMASAAAGEDRAAYDAARRDAAAADRDLRASLERLAQLGYAPG